MDMIFSWAVAVILDQIEDAATTITTFSMILLCVGVICTKQTLEFCVLSQLIFPVWYRSILYFILCENTVHNDKACENLKKISPFSQMCQYFQLSPFLSQNEQP